MAGPLVTVLITNYNYGRYLADAIESALNQTYPSVEVVVVDDGSTDESRDIIARFGQRIIPVLKENGGQASAFNAGFAASRGEIICLLDSDDVYLPEKASTVVQVFESNPEIGWCFHRIRQVATETGETLKLRPEETSYACDLRPSLKKGWFSFPSPATCGLCFRRALLAQVLPMPEGKNVTIADYYLRYAAFVLSKGYYLSQPLAHLRIHGENAYSRRQEQDALKARIYVLAAYWLRVRFPSFWRFTDRLLSIGLGTYMRFGGVEAEYRPFVETYLSSTPALNRLFIQLRARYYWQRLLLRPAYHRLKELWSAPKPIADGRR